MELGLKDKVAVVTGASSGIGRAIALQLAEEGAVVVVVARRADALAETVRLIAAEGGRAEVLALDIAVPGAIDAAIADVAERHGRLDIVVNNAGKGSFGLLEDVDNSAWQDAFALNVDAPFAAMRAAFPIMRRQGGGAIVNISSILGVRAQSHSAPYSAAKAALVQLTNVAALEGGPDNIRVNAIQVGSILTEGSRAYLDADPAAKRAIASAIPMNRWGTPEEIAAVVVFLCSDQASFVSGASIPVDGALAGRLALNRRFKED